MCVASVAIFTAVAVYLFGFHFFGWLESDATVPALLAGKVLDAKSIVVDNWYYGNGDIWIVSPHLFTLVPVAILGVGPAALLLGNLIGFAAELAVFVRTFRRYCEDNMTAVFATVATLMVWSKAHAAYEYIQIAYGLNTLVYIVSFHLFVTLANDTSVSRRRWAGAAVWLLLVTLNNPTRSLVYLLVPAFTAFVWPWRTVAIRRRLALAATTFATWAVGFALYTWWLVRYVSLSNPRGHVGFTIVGWVDIKANLVMLERGLMLLCAGGGSFESSVKSGVWIPGAVLLVGALALVSREVFASRESTPLRWMSLLALAQLGVVLGPLVIGNVLDSPEAARYLMSSLTLVVGIAVLLAVKTCGETARMWWRRLSIGFLSLIPIAALFGALDAAPPDEKIRVWPDSAEIEKVADELVRRNLTFGFAERLSANLLTLDTHGKVLACRTIQYDVIMPQRWLAPTECYSKDLIPDRFFVMTYQAEMEQGALHNTMPNEVERFAVGDTYEVHVFRKQDVPLGWLDLPILGGDLAVFPTHIPANHLQLFHGNVAVEGPRLVATGEPGILVYGPYIDLPKGKYVATWYGSGIESTGELTFRVTSAFGRHRIATLVTLDAHTVSRDRHALVKLPFRLKRPGFAIDFRVHGAGGARVSFDELVIERAP